MTEKTGDYDDLFDVLTDAGLALPPIPESLRPAIRARGRWMWSSREDIERDEMYMFQPAWLEGLAGSAEDFVALSHAGHGANSYGLNFHLVYGPLALFVQDAWGGVYMDPEKTAREIKETFEFCRELVEVVETGPAVQSEWGVRLVVLYSSFRGFRRDGFVRRLGRGTEIEWVEDDSPFDSTVAALSELVG